MQVQLSAGQKALVREAISSGRISSEEEAIRQALSLARGEGRRIGSELELQQFAENVKRRGLARLTAQQDRS
jgi:Arc/MetJ-type ribon-helix-helix transcriptional regulator